MILRYGLFAGATLVATVAVMRPEQEAAYAVPIAEAHAMLLRTGGPPFVFGTLPPNVTTRGEGPTRVAWIVSQEGGEIMRYTAELAPAGEKATRVNLSLTGATEGRFGNVEQRLAQNPTIRNLYLVAMRERIASTLERRPYELSRIYPATVAARTANMAAIVRNLDAAAAEHRRQDRENIEKAYRDEAAGVRY